uniref:Uncharacterized protein n=1 Tax=Anguilla anguilla TaxID=7936 RepID=A0A0E9QS57_ANGAN
MCACVRVCACTLKQDYFAFCKHVSTFLFPEFIMQDLINNAFPYNYHQPPGPKHIFYFLFHLMVKNE